MRHVIAMILLGTLLTGCGAPPPLIPTVAQLPTPTDSPIPPVAISSPTALPPAETPSGPAPTEPPPASPISTTAPGAAPAATLAPAEAGPCGPIALSEALAGLDLAALTDALTDLQDHLRTAAVGLPGWTLTASLTPTADEAAEASPLAGLRFGREGQEALVLLIPAPEALDDFYAGCLADPDFYRTGDVAADAAITVEPLPALDGGVLAVIAQMVEMGAGDPVEMITEVYTMRSDDVLLQVVSIPVLDQMLGRIPLSRGEVEGLLTALAQMMPGRGD